MTVHRYSGGFRLIGVAAALLLTGFLSGALSGQPASSGPPLSAVQAVIHADNPRQTVVGFGGDLGTGIVGDLTPGARRDVLAFTFSEMRLNVVRMDHVPYEGATAASVWGANDNADAFRIDWERFNFCTKPGVLCNDDWKELLAEIRGFGVNGDYAGSIQGPRWNGFDGHSAFDEDEMAENLLAMFLHYRDRHGVALRWVAPFSEPSGGGINWRITPAQAAGVIAKLGRRLETGGFRDVRMIVPEAVGIGSSAQYAAAILGDPLARPYVGAIGYHTYDTKEGGSSPDDSWIAAHRRLLEIARSAGVPTRMTEFCCLSGLLSRANHIYNELEYADSQTYIPQTIARKTGRDGHGEEVTESHSESVVFYTVGEGKRLVRVGPTRHTGVAIGHYSRFIRPGAVRVPGSSSDAGLRVQAFRDRERGGIVVVIINNREMTTRASLAMSGAPRVRRITRAEQTAEHRGTYWVPIDGVTVPDRVTMVLTVPGRSITSVAADVVE